MMRFMLGMVTLLILSACSSKPAVTVFLAPCFSPIMSSIKQPVQKKQTIQLTTEVAGSQMICRKITELGRQCDLIVLADSNLFKSHLAEQVTWRIDFSHDRIVLGIGIRAPYVDEAEKSWISVLQKPEVILGRVDENLGPIGYRTLLTWQLQEQSGYPGLAASLRANTKKQLDHVDHLAALLKNGDLHYAFLYKTTCMQHDIRFIPLDRRIHLGDASIDYSHANVTYKKILNNQQTTQTVTGKRITYGLSIPENSVHAKQAENIVIDLFKNYQSLFNEKGFSTFKPKFYGSKENYKAFKAIADYAGTF